MGPPDWTRLGTVLTVRSAVVLRVSGLAVAGLALVWLAPGMGGQVARPETDPASVHYALSFPEPEHRWMHVLMTASGLSSAPLSLRMSVSSPGRYARHAFAKNVFDVDAQDGAGNPLEVTRTAMARWKVSGHDGTVQFGYRVYGDRIDGTYLAIDETHAHLNMPAVLMWGHGLEDRTAMIQFEPPDGKDWRVATQLYPSEDPFTFTAPNLQYLLDSPAELSQFAGYTFNVVDPADSDHEPSFRIALHHTGDDTELTRYARDVENIVREMVTVFGEFPRFETGRYTFIADYLPRAHGDAMEHRNSTVLTAPAALRQQASGLIGSVSHEFFHVWNVERIRPRSLEPFDFETANPSGELWLAEGFTNYYGALILQRAGLRTVADTLARFSSAIDTVRLGPGRQFRSASDMSRLAPFVDAASAIDRTNWDNVFISYYTWGEVLGLGLDLLLRTRYAESTGEPTLTLDDYMRLLWQRFGRDGATTPGVVDRPYIPDDARAALADLTEDQGFAEEFFDRYVDGHEAIDFAPLVERAGLRLQPRAPDRVWLGSPVLRFEGGGARVVAPVPFGSPLYEAGVARDDRLVSIDGRTVSSPGGLGSVLSDLDDGQEVSLEFRRRDDRLTTTLVVESDPTLELVSLERLGASPTPAQRRFRDAWLGSQIGR